MNKPIFLLLGLLLSAPLMAQEHIPCDDRNPLRQPFFGDTHVHTAYSFDARAQDTRNTPADAYNFAKGGRMGIQPYNEKGEALRHIQLDRPLDFTAVTDHAEFLGEVSLCLTEGSKGYKHPACYIYRNHPKYSDMVLAAYGMVLKKRWGFCEDENSDQGFCLAEGDSIWKQVQQAAEEAYDRSSDCNFTSFIAYEWTATVGTGKNLHRNVIFKNEKVPSRPKSWINSPSAEHLWDSLQEECVDALPGCDALTIPHNSNISAGLMFENAAIQNDEDVLPPITAEQAARRARWEPLVEIVQHKGESECDNRQGWVEDEFCGHEKMPYDSFGSKNTGRMAEGAQGQFRIWTSKLMGMDVSAKLPDPNNYVRWALKEGLRQQAELGVNGLKFGISAATDTHIAAPGQTTEKGHPGHGGAGMGAREGVKGLPDELEFGPGGLTVLWAEENTRESLFAAMTRKEAYATSGTRPILRFFGGWDYPENLCESPDWVKQGYAGGVPMGGDLPAAKGKNPRFVVAAMRDVAANPLQRVQVIKGWYKDGELNEEVLDVAGGDTGATVDLQTCATSGRGYQSLCTVWEDKHFDPEAEAFYYTRAIENPACRWSQFVCADAGVDCKDPSTISEGLENCCSPDHKPTVQERAWSSPIWYSPQS